LFHKPECIAWEDGFLAVPYEKVECAREEAFIEAQDGTPQHGCHGEERDASTVAAVVCEDQIGYLGVCADSKNAVLDSGSIAVRDQDPPILVMAIYNGKFERSHVLCISGSGVHGERGRPPPRLLQLHGVHGVAGSIQR
ncbi:hypothetical protein EJ02DRAFT_483877, partial [Clathrospora elynae]